MKRRSHRFPIEDTPQDDWVDESWTVDCVCGVNFDDGEEMVNCDECGVWVHTRCSRYVKGEKSFACHKCKLRNDRDENEETEVAQLLADLPMKTPRMDNPQNAAVSSNKPYKRPWLEIPIEERVHVQGIPGGDPSLFAGLSSVFSPQLWKSRGYIPKKFNFQYREFPSWDEEEEEEVKRNSEENENTNNENIAGDLLSLSEGNRLPTPFDSSVGVISPNENGKCEKVSSEEVKKLEGEDTETRHIQDTVNEDPRFRRVPRTIMNYAKRKKEDGGSSRDRSEKKRAKVSEYEGDLKKKTTLPSATASTISNDGKQREFYEHRGPKTVKVDTESRKTGDSRISTPADRLSNGSSAGEYNAAHEKKHAAANVRGLGANSFDTSRCSTISDGQPKEGGGGYQSAKVNEVPASGSLPTNDEVVRDAPDSSTGNNGGSTRTTGIDLQKSERIVKDITVAGPKALDQKSTYGSSGDIIPSCSYPKSEVNAESDENHSVVNGQSLPLSEGKLDGTRLSAYRLEASENNSSRNVIVKDAVISSSEASDRKVPDVVMSTVEVDGKKDDTHATSVDYRTKREPSASEGSFEVGKSSSGHKHSSKPSKEISKLVSKTSSSDCNQRRVVVSVGKSSSKSSTSVISKSPTSGSRSSADDQAQSTDGKHRGSSDGVFGNRREKASSHVVRDDEMSPRSKKVVKEFTKSSLSSESKASQSSKFPHALVHKRSLPDSNDPTLSSSSKPSKASSLTANPGSRKSTSPLLTAGASSAPNKIPSSGSLHTSENNNQPSPQASLKVNTSQMQPPASSNPPATLSDEELALLLHQELNSSSRVPRVPRMRHAGSLPHLTSPTGANMQAKRTSSSGGKDYSSTNRRKSKDSARDSSHGSRDLCNEAKKMDRVPSSPDSDG